MFGLKKMNNTTDVIKSALQSWRKNGAHADVTGIDAIQNALFKSCVSTQVSNWMDSLNLTFENCDMFKCLDTNAANINSAILEMEKSKFILESLQEKLGTYEEQPDKDFHQRYSHVVLPTDDYIQTVKKTLVTIEAMEISDATLAWQVLSGYFLNISMILKAITLDYTTYIRGGATL